MECAYATVWESIADVIPEQPAVVQGDRRVSWGEYDGRAARLAGAFLAAGLGPGSKVALYLYNSPEYCEANYAALKIRGVPVNVNYRYLDEELAYLLDNSDAEAVVFHSSLGERVAPARKGNGAVKLWLEVDDGGAHLDGTARYEDAIAGSEPAPRVVRSDDDHYILYTGGTTGMPKGVVYRQGPMVAGFLAQLPLLLGEGPITDPAGAAAFARQLAAEGRRYAALPACPLMHGTGAWAGLYAPHLVGGSTVLAQSRALEPAELLEAAEREGVLSMVIVGDSFARPLVRELDRRAASGAPPYDLASWRLLVSSGAMFSAETKAALCDHVPHLMIVDTIGSSEGVMGSSITAQGNSGQTARFSLLPTTKVFTEDGREVQPGSGDPGLVAVGGNVPLGYYRDEAKTAATFREIDGVRYSFPGDWATVADDGSIVLLGRGGSCINTGGEKVYPEEVEEAAKSHPDVEDCLVFGIPDDRFGQAVAAVASPVAGAAPTIEEILDHTRRRLAGYKVPRRLVMVESVPRTPSGKADYPAARTLLDEPA